MEDTQRVLSERQVASLSTLAGGLVDANTKKDVFDAIERGLAARRTFPSHSSTPSRVVAPRSAWFRESARLRSSRRAARNRCRILGGAWPVDILFGANRGHDH